MDCGGGQAFEMATRLFRKHPHRRPEISQAASRKKPADFPVKFIFDTDTCIFLLRGLSEVVARVQRVPPEEIAISSITRYELLYGVKRCNPKFRKREADKVERLIDMIQELPFTAGIAEHAAEIRFQLEKTGKPIGPMDILIAATALEADLDLITGNTREFSRIGRLRLQNWTVA